MDKLKKRDIFSITRSLVDEYKTLIESVDQAFTAESRGQIPNIVKTDEFETQIQAISKSLKTGKRFPMFLKTTYLTYLILLQLKRVKWTIK